MRVGRSGGFAFGASDLVVAVSAPRLLLITDLSILDEQALLERALRALRSSRAGGPQIAIGLRDHGQGARRRLLLGRELRALTSAHGAKLLVHDRVDLALAIGADGVQLGARSLGIAEARSLLPPGAIVGSSCHTAEQLIAARAQHATFATLSPIFNSPGKAAPLGHPGFAALAMAAGDLPILALGGIDATTVQPALRAGAVGVAAISAWLRGDALEAFVEAALDSGAGC